jgi:hypothetical protein
MNERRKEGRKERMKVNSLIIIRRRSEGREGVSFSKRESDAPTVALAAGLRSLGEAEALLADRAEGTAVPVGTQHVAGRRARRVVAIHRTTVTTSTTTAADNGTVAANVSAPANVCGGVAQFTHASAPVGALVDLVARGSEAVVVRLDRQILQALVVVFAVRANLQKSLLKVLQPQHE